ncbi:MAG: hypothetical protein HC826_02545 [Rhodospirillales bacterium]|nr:hypothetical protein [Rhodospirillales bacterium]
MNDEEADGVIALERQLTDWMKRQPVPVEWSIMAVGISAARLIYGVRALQGDNAGIEAARLLRNSVNKAMRVFEQTSISETRH